MPRMLALPWRVVLKGVSRSSKGVPATPGVPALPALPAQASEGMQEFVLCSSPEVAAELHCDDHVVSQIKEVVQILYTALLWAGFPSNDQVTMADGALAGPLAPIWKHPCVYWCMACKAHMDWTIRLGLALCHEKRERFGTDHAYLPHLKHLRAHVEAVSVAGTGFPNTCIGADVWLRMCVPEDKRGEYLSRVALAQPPEGCLFGVVAMDEEFRHVDPDGLVNCVQSYRKYYSYKAKNQMRMRWHRELTPPQQIHTAFEFFYPAQQPMLERPPRKPKVARKSKSAPDERGAKRSRRDSTESVSSTASGDTELAHSPSPVSVM